MTVKAWTPLTIFSVRTCVYMTAKALTPLTISPVRTCVYMTVPVFNFFCIIVIPSARYEPKPLVH